TDDGVPAEYAYTVAAQYAEPYVVTLWQGEKNKNFNTYKYILGKLMKYSFSRSDAVIAVGGGVVGDIAGFAAATYMRGIDFYNIPTTFLSQVDSSIGGKVAVDMDGVKNIIGAFHQPKKVVIDPDGLKTLDPRQLSAGIAESIKMAATCDAELFELLEKSTDFAADCDRIIEASLMIKKRVVEEDPKEQGLRRVLNFGHTIGHAIESAKMGELLHGECVAIGMLPMTDDATRARLEAVLEKYALPTGTSVNAADLLPIMLHDKKKTSGGVSIVRVHEIGSFEIKTADEAELGKYLLRI
ncbi:MAG: 3-dehydroquinate synthase, partial [Clostridia bacterium]|nr:3-dehydroquinate synthase [Clostridia bacterium]